MLSEEKFFIPFTTSNLPNGPWLIFSPHADDETYGMGGTLIKARASGIETHLVVVTDGALGGEGENLVNVREKEVSRVASALCIASLDFWRRPDRSLDFKESLVAKTSNKIREIAPAVVFFPGPMELHPDHRNTSLIVWSALQSLVAEARPIAYSYEISVQNPVNVLVDISQQCHEKSILMGMYSSQNDQNNYEELVKALDKARTFSLPSEVDSAEGFFQYSKKQLEQSLDQVLLEIIKGYLQATDFDGC